MRVLYRGTIFADYFQIYLRDDAHPDLPDDYSPESLARRLIVGRHGVIMQTARNMTVPVSVEWHDRRPAPDLGLYQHVVEASFEAPTGWLVLAGLTDDEASAPRLAVRPGPVGIVAGQAGLDTLSDDGLDGADRYDVMLWQAEASVPLTVRKSWPGG